FQNYPNPFNPATTITYELPAEGRVYMKAFDSDGRELAVLQDGIQSAGFHQSVFRGNNLSSGVYFIRLSSGPFSQTIKLLLTK
ncbi:MAG: T9SS C-terminal target domain-containing protein, partial [Ignavibacteriae bacterium]